MWLIVVRDTGRDPRDGSVYIIETDAQTSGNQSGNNIHTEHPKPDYTGTIFQSFIRTHFFVIL